MSSGALKNTAFQIASNIVKSDLQSNKVNSIFDIIDNECADKNDLQNKKDYLILLNKFRSKLVNSEELSNHQKFDYCAVERYIMKKYLKNVLKELK